MASRKFKCHSEITIHRAKMSEPFPYVLCNKTSYCLVVGGCLGDGAPWVAHISAHLARRGTDTFVPVYIFMVVVSQTGLENRVTPSRWKDKRDICPLWKFQVPWAQAFSLVTQTIEYAGPIALGLYLLKVGLKHPDNLLLLRVTTSFVSDFRVLCLLLKTTEVWSSNLFSWK